MSEEEKSIVNNGLEKEPTNKTVSTSEVTSKAEVEKEVAAQEKEVATQEKEVATQEKEVATQEKEVASQEKEVASQEKEVASQEKEVAAQEKEVASQEKEVASQEKEVASQEKEVAEQEQKSSTNVNSFANTELSKNKEAEKSMEPSTNNSDATTDHEVIEKLKVAYTTLKNEISKVIVGQERVIDEVLITIFSGGHCLLVGVPGLAKTKLIATLADALSLSFSRIQFTPDLMPSDITGTEVIQEDKMSGQREFKFLKGPIFANVILADEINRTPPKTQAALLEAMQEHQVTAGGQKHILPQPFFVLATQNPIEQEGTYPLPEAQLDRFMFNTLVDYPTQEEEKEIMKLTTTDTESSISQVISEKDIISLQKIIRRIPISDDEIEYAMSFARMTRVTTPDVPDFIKNWLSWGAGPRASQYMILGAKAHAILRGKSYVSRQDIKAVVHPVLRHRIITNYSASAEGITPDKVIDKLIETVDEQYSKKSNVQ